MRLAALVISVSVVGGATSAGAQTPDGVTPANEGVCDPLLGGTPGLYGLCVAFCEAQDCVDLDPINGQCQASDPRVLSAYNRKKAPDDPGMPCIKENACPCWTERELDDLRYPQPGDYLSCEDSLFITRWDRISGPNDYTYARAWNRGFDDYLCQMADRCLDGSCFVVRFLNITAEEYEACRADVLRSGSERGCQQ